MKYEDMLRETRSKVRVGRWGVNFIREGDETGVPIELGYVQSPDGGSEEGNVERRMGRGEVGSTHRKGSKRVYTLVYADDVVLIAKEEEGLRCMIERLGWCLERKGLELNAKKSRVMRFRKGDVDRKR